MNPSNPMFAPLVQNFLSLSGLDSSDARECLGFEIDFPNGVVRVAPHPLHSTLGLVEVEMPGFDSADSRALSLLHRLNHASILRHAWIATLDDQDHLVLVNTFPLGETDATALENLLSDGIGRAESLLALLSSDLQTNSEERAESGLSENFNPASRA